MRRISMHGRPNAGVRVCRATTPPASHFPARAHAPSAQDMLPQAGGFQCRRNPIWHRHCDRAHAPPCSPAARPAHRYNEPPVGHGAPEVCGLRASRRVHPGHEAAATCDSHGAQTMVCRAARAARCCGRDHHHRGPTFAWLLYMAVAMVVPCVFLQHVTPPHNGLCTCAFRYAVASEAQPGRRHRGRAGRGRRGACQPPLFSNRHTSSSQHRVAAPTARCTY